MIIDNPLVLPIILLALLVGIGLCLYVILRFFRNLGQRSTSSPSSKKTGGQAGSSFAEEPETAQRLAEWVRPFSGPSEQARIEPARPAANQEADGEAMEVFRVLRVGSLGELVVEVEGRRYQKISQIRDGTVGRRVLLAIQELSDFVGPHGKKPLPEMHRLSNVPPLATGPTEPADPRLDYLSQVEDPALGTQSAEQRVDLVGYWRKGLGSALRRGPVEQAVGPKSFIDEIEELLQLRLASRPDLAQHGIHFKSTPEGELRIEVGARLYDQLDAIPDPGIVVFLKETIQTWEKR